MFVIVIAILIVIAWYFNSFNIRERVQFWKDKTLDAIDNRPRQLITSTIPNGKEFCIQNSFTNIIGWDSINECCVFEWRKNNHILQTCITAQIGGETIYNTWDGSYVDNYKDYLGEVT